MVKDYRKDKIHSGQCYINNKDHGYLEMLQKQSSHAVVKDLAMLQKGIGSQWLSLEILHKEHSS